MQILNIIIDIFITILYILLFNYYLNNKYTQKDNNQLLKYVIQFIIIYLIFNNEMINLYKYFIIIFLLIILILSSTYFYKTHKVDLVKDIFLLLIISALIFVFITSLYEIIFETVFTNLLISIIKLPKIFLNIITVYLSYIFISLYLQYKNKDFHLNIKIFKAISLSISILYAVFVLLNVKEIFLFPRIHKTMIFTFIIYNVSLILFDRYQVRHEMIERKLLLEKQRITDEKKYLNELLTADEEIRQLRHDLNNTYTMLQGHLNAGEYDKAKAFIDKNTNKISKASALIHTGFSSIDSVLEEKIEMMNDKEIIYHEYIKHMYLGKISDSDLSIIIGLAFDNAIEATEKIDNHREIQFRSDNHINYLIIEISNSIIPGSHPNFNKSSKGFEDHRHGFGIKSIKEYVDLYKGEITYDIKDNKVILTIIVNTE